MAAADASPAVPFLPKPTKLSEDMPGYAGFDPLGFSNLFDVKFLQEAEIKHCKLPPFLPFPFSLSTRNHIMHSVSPQ